MPVAGLSPFRRGPSITGPIDRCAGRCSTGRWTLMGRHAISSGWPGRMRRSGAGRPSRRARRRQRVDHRHRRGIVPARDRPRVPARLGHGPGAAGFPALPDRVRGRGRHGPALRALGRSPRHRGERTGADDRGLPWPIGLRARTIARRNLRPSPLLLGIGNGTVRAIDHQSSPRRHPENCWDLGDEGSIHLKDACLKVVLGAHEEEISVVCSPERGAEFDRFGGRFALEQDSSGGENWRSHNHLNRNHVVPHTLPRLSASARPASNSPGFATAPSWC